MRQEGYNFRSEVLYAKKKISLLESYRYICVKYNTEHFCCCDPGYFCAAVRAKIYAVVI